ncbi:hypothetical protein Tco_0494908 [Tanacetum coccineum]
MLSRLLLFISQTKWQEDKVAENASNKRKWEGNYNGSSSQQNKGHKVPKAHTTRPINKKAYAGSLPLCNQCKKYHVDMIHGRVMESKPKIMQDAIEFATELMDKKISTLAKCQAKNKNPKNRALQIPILLTTKEALWQVRSLLAMNVGIKGTTREIA